MPIGSWSILVDDKSKFKFVHLLEARQVNRELSSLLAIDHFAIPMSIVTSKLAFTIKKKVINYLRSAFKQKKKS